MNSNRRSKQLSSLEIERELSQLCNIEEDDSGDESGNELSVTHCDNEDEDFQLDQESSTSEDSEADIPTESHFDSETQDSNLHSERGIRRSRGRRPGSSGRAVHSGSITRGGRQVRTSSLPEIGMRQVASDGTEWKCIPSFSGGTTGRRSRQNVLREILLLL